MEEYLFRIVQNITGVVKPFPFVYTAMLMLFWALAPILRYEAISTIDSLIFLSVIMVLFLIALSYCIKLCKWHRLQCVLPLLPQIVDRIDTNIYEFGANLATVNYAVIGLIVVLSLINAYFVFMKPMLSKWKQRRNLKQQLR